ncbi:hypothetical protein OH458_15805 [Vibrio sp. MarTm2]|nr:hypothetical protein [Vibrio sp. MarTm2]MDA0129535.1 hypothetical protein [Vibrio sp. MarTm2]
MADNIVLGLGFFAAYDGDEILPGVVSLPAPLNNQFEQQYLLMFEDK